MTVKTAATHSEVYFCTFVRSFKTLDLRRRTQRYGVIMSCFLHFSSLKNTKVERCRATFQAGASVLALINTPSLPHSWNNDCSQYQKQRFFSSGTCGEAGGGGRKKNPSWCGNILSFAMGRLSGRFQCNRGRDGPHSSALTSCPKKTFYLLARKT